MRCVETCFLAALAVLGGRSSFGPRIALRTAFIGKSVARRSNSFVKSASDTRCQWHQPAASSSACNPPGRPRLFSHGKCRHLLLHALRSVRRAQRCPKRRQHVELAFTHGEREQRRLRVAQRFFLRPHQPLELRKHRLDRPAPSIQPRDHQRLCFLWQNVRQNVQNGVAFSRGFGQLDGDAAQLDAGSGFVLHARHLLVVHRCLVGLHEHALSHELQRQDVTMRCGSRSAGENPGNVAAVLSLSAPNRLWVCAR